MRIPYTVTCATHQTSPESGCTGFIGRSTHAQAYITRLGCSQTRWNAPHPARNVCQGMRTMRPCLSKWLADPFTPLRSIQHIETIHVFHTATNLGELRRHILTRCESICKKVGNRDESDERPSRPILDILLRNNPIRHYAMSTSCRRRVGGLGFPHNYPRHAE